MRPCDILVTMDTNFKGALAMSKVRTKCLELGYVLSIPEIDVRYDGIVDDKNKLHKIQVKYADGIVSTTSTGSVKVKLLTQYRNRTIHHYEIGEVDALVVYLPKADKLYWIPPEIFCGKKDLTLRLELPKNNQTKKVILASDYEWL